MLGTSNDTPVLIVGSGLAGLYLALLLVRDGNSVRIIEKDTQHHQGSRACDIQVRTAEYLHLLGLLCEVDRLGRREVGLQRNDDNDFDTWEIVDQGRNTASPHAVEGRTISQALHEDIIRTELAKYDCRVELGKTLRSFTQDSTGVSAEVVIHSAVKEQDERIETIRVLYLAGADGIHGIIRKSLGCKYLGQPKTGEVMLLCDAPVKGIRSQVWNTRATEGGSLRFTGRRLEDSPELFNIAITSPKAKCDVGKLNLQQPGAAQKLFSETIAKSHIKIGDPIWSAHYRSDLYMFHKFAIGRVFILGDAAHGLPCLGGQGMNASIQDAVNIYWKLSLVLNDISPISLLETYEEERLPVVGMMLNKATDPRTTYKIGERVESPSATLPTEDEDVCMLGVNYRWSSIVLDTRTPTRATKEDMQRRAYVGYSSSLVAGDRAPNATALITLRTGVATSLFKVFDLRRHTILLFKSVATVADVTPTLNILKIYPPGTIQTVVLSRRSLDTKIKTDHVLTDSQGHAFDTYKVKGDQLTIVIVRPDAYIGAIVRSPEKMLDYFSKIFLPVGQQPL